MAAAAWVFYNRAKRFLADGTFDLDTNVYRMGLVQTTSNYQTVTLTAYASITNEVASGNGYASSGKTVSATVWTAGASASEYRFNGNAVVWSASGGNIVGIQGAVVFQSGGKLMMFSVLTTANFTVADGNTITISPNATNGLFELN